MAARDVPSMFAATWRDHGCRGARIVARSFLVDGIGAAIDCPAMARAVAVGAFEPLPMPVSGRKHVQHG
jgi:hypothetical protein